MNDIKLKLIKSGEFLGTICDFHKDEYGNIYMTREQIGKALQYKTPDDAIRRMHNRKQNKERLDKFSTQVAMSRVEGSREVARDTVLYTERGIYEVCRISQQPVANDFYDWVYDQLILLRQTSGVVTLGSEKEFLDNYFPALSEEVKLAMVQDLNENIRKQQEQIKEMQPKVDDWSAFLDTKGNITIANVAKSLNIKGVGRNKLFEILRNNKVLRKNNEPYQTFVDREYFEVLQGTKNGFKYNQTVVTGRGMSFINKKLKEWGYA